MYIYTLYVYIYIYICICMYSLLLVYLKTYRNYCLSPFVVLIRIIVCINLLSITYCTFEMFVFMACLSEL